MDNLFLTASRLRQCGFFARGGSYRGDANWPDSLVEANLAALLAWRAELPSM